MMTTMMTMIKRKRSKLFLVEPRFPFVNRFTKIPTLLSIDIQSDYISKFRNIKATISFSSFFLPRDSRSTCSSKKIKWKRNFSRGPTEIGEILWPGEEVVEDSSECFPWWKMDFHLYECVAHVHREHRIQGIYFSSSNRLLLPLFFIEWGRGEKRRGWFTTKNRNAT